MASSEGFSARLPFLFMAVFFSYATYVQINDPDKVQWLALYGVAAAASFAAVLGLKGPASLASILAAAGAATMLSSRILHPPSCDMGQNVVAIGDHKLTLDVNTENGRENAGLLIVLSWNLLAAISTATVSLSAGATLGLLAIAGAVLASAVLVPAFVMSPEKLKDYPHCSGLGITPDKLFPPAPPAQPDVPGAPPVAPVQD